MALKTLPYDSAELLTSPKAIAAYLAEAFAENDPKAITQALGIVARARGMTQIARETGIARESLYKALRDEGNPEFSTIIKVVKALGLKMAVKPTASPEGGEVRQKRSRSRQRTRTWKVRRVSRKPRPARAKAKVS